MTDEDKTEEHFEDDYSSAYDFEHGEKIEQFSFDHSAGLPWKAEIESAKEFFNTEILYRYDILDPEERQQLSGSYQINVSGEKGGTWSVVLDEDLEVKADGKLTKPDVTLTIDQSDFLRLVNGSLNPQLAFVAGKMSSKGDLDKALALQALLCPLGE